LADKKKPDDEKSTDETKEEKPVESTPESEETPAEKIEEKPEEKPEEEPKEEPPTEEEIKEETAELEEEIEKQKEEKIIEEADKPEEKIVEEEQPSDAKPKKEVKKEVKEKKPDRGPDFKYIVRLANTDVDGEKNIVYGLKSIKGISVQMATLIADKTGIKRTMKMGDLSDKQVEKIQEIIDDISKSAPSWMLNHRKDYDTGDDIHLIGSDIDMRLRDEINILKKIRSYRGIRHERGLRVRGQRTRANNRSGLSLGVSKKRE
jgi:small subunit ribosomal protein S13